MYHSKFACVNNKPWHHYDVIILIKAGFQPEKDEQIYLNAINSKFYFYEVICEFFPLNSKFTDVIRRVSEVAMTSF